MSILSYEFYYFYFLIIYQSRFDHILDAANRNIQCLDLRQCLKLFEQMDQVIFSLCFDIRLKVWNHFMIIYC